MARAYQLVPTWEEIEDAMVAVLKADATVAAYALNIASFHGTLEDAITQAAVRAPAFVIVHTSFEADPEGMESDRLATMFHILCLSRNLRSRAAQRTSQAAGEVGVYQMARDAIELLVRNDLDLDGCEPLRLVEGELIGSGTTEGGRDRTLSIYRLGLEGTVELRRVDPDESLETVTLATSIEGTEDNPVVTDTITIEVA